MGDRCEHRLARTVTGYDNMLFTLLTQNPAPLYLNHHFVAQAGHERVPFNSALTLALVTGQSVSDMTPNVMTNLGWSEVRLPAPAYEGDTIYSESRIELLRESSKRATVGIVGIKTVGYTQDGTVVIAFVRAVMMYRRGCVPAQVRPQPNEAASR